MEDLETWVNAVPNHKRILHKVQDKDGLFPLLAECMLNFIKEKPEVFHKRAFDSKSAFLEISKWKRSIVFVFLLRQV